MGVFSPATIDISSPAQNTSITLTPGDETSINMLLRARNEEDYQVLISFESHPQISLSTDQNFIMSSGSSRLLNVEIKIDENINFGDYPTSIHVRFYPLKTDLNPSEYETKTIQTTLVIQPPERVSNTLITLSDFEGRTLSNTISLFKKENDNLFFIKDYTLGRLEDRLEPGDYYISSLEQGIEILSHSFTIASDERYQYNHQAMSHYFTETLGILFEEDEIRQIIVDYEWFSLSNPSEAIWIEFSLIRNNTVIETPQFQEIGTVVESSFEGRYIYTMREDNVSEDTAIALRAFYFNNDQRVNISDLTPINIRDSNQSSGILGTLNSPSVLLLTLLVVMICVIVLILIKRFLIKSPIKKHSPR